MLQGTLKDGFYQFEHVKVARVNHNCSVTPVLNRVSVFSSVVKNDVKQSKSSSVLSVTEKWHRKLGHPSNHVLKLVLNQLNEEHFNNEEFHFFQAC